MALILSLFIASLEKNNPFPILGNAFGQEGGRSGGSAGEISVKICHLNASSSHISAPGCKKSGWRSRLDRRCPPTSTSQSWRETRKPFLNKAEGSNWKSGGSHWIKWINLSSRRSLLTGFNQERGQQWRKLEAERRRKHFQGCHPKQTQIVSHAHPHIHTHIYMEANRMQGDRWEGKALIGMTPCHTLSGPWPAKPRTARGHVCQLINRPEYYPHLFYFH